MKEPPTLADELHVLITMDDRTHIITREQALQITAAQNSGQVKTVSIGNDPITIHQIAGMPTLSTYRRQMKTKLAEKHQRMCRRCGAIMPMGDKCSCVENNALPVIAQAAKENPALTKRLKEIGCAALALPPLPVVALPEAPPTPQEREQIRAIQAAKNKFLGKVEMPKPKYPPVQGCGSCNGSGKYVLEGIEVTCHCVTNQMFANRKPVVEVEQSGTLPPVPSPVK